MVVWGCCVGAQLVAGGRRKEKDGMECFLFPKKEGTKQQLTDCITLSDSKRDKLGKLPSLEDILFIFG